jgi:hypothetical protein
MSPFRNTATSSKRVPEAVDVRQNQSPLVWLLWVCDNALA